MFFDDKLTIFFKAVLQTQTENHYALLTYTVQLTGFDWLN